MLITEIARLKVGDKFKYFGKPATVVYVRPKYSDEKTWIVDKNAKDKGNWVMIPDKSIAVGFEVVDGVNSSKIGLVSTTDSKMIVDGIFVAANFVAFGYSK